MLSFKNVTFSYEKGPAFTFDFALSLGQPYALRAPSGYGKTTLLNLVAGFLTPISGEILLNSVSLEKLSPRLRPVSYVQQEGILFGGLSVQRNLHFTGASLGEIHEILTALDMGDYLTKKAGDLSGGQRQRVLIAIALLQKREIILLDEPFKGLDEDTKKRVLKTLIRFVDFKQQWVIYTTHDQEVFDVPGSLPLII